jgi:hypothetical protein
MDLIKQRMSNLVTNMFGQTGPTSESSASDAGATANEPTGGFDSILQS